MSVVVERSVDIAAPAAVVWAVLLDVERWPEWTASMSSLRRTRPGPLAVGEQVVVRQPRLPVATWTVTALDDGRSFTWEAGNAAVRGAADHVLTPRIAGGCTVTLRVTQRGPAARVAGLLLSRLTRDYLRMEAEGLKARSEGLH